MVLKRFRKPETGLLALKSFKAEKYLKKIGLGKEDHHFWKQVGKALLCTYALFGAVWLLNETSPFGWWTLKPKPREEKEMARLYERRKFPYPGDSEAMEDFVAKGGMIGTTIGPKGIIETDKDSYNIQKELQDKKFEQEALKLWLRMRNEEHPIQTSQTLLIFQPDRSPGHESDDPKKHSVDYVKKYMIKQGVPKMKKYEWFT